MICWQIFTKGLKLFGSACYVCVCAFAGRTITTYQWDDYFESVRGCCLYIDLLLLPLLMVLLLSTLSLFTMWNIFKENKRTTINYTISSFELASYFTWYNIYDGLCSTHLNCHQCTAVLFTGGVLYSFFTIPFFVLFWLVSCSVFIFLFSPFKIMTIMSNLFFRLLSLHFIVS